MVGGAQRLVAGRPTTPHRAKHRGGCRRSSLRSGHHRRGWSSTRRCPSVHLAERLVRGVVAGWDGDPRYADHQRRQRTPAAALGFAHRRGQASPVDGDQLSRPGNASLRSPLPGDGPLPSPGLPVPAGPRSVRRDAARGQVSRWLSSRGDSQVAIPQAHERPQRDRAVEPLVGAPRGAPLSAVGQVRVLRSPERGRRLRLVAALQVPDPRS